MSRTTPQMLRQDLDQKFRMLDLNRDGLLDLKDIAESYKDFGLPPQASKMLIRSITTQKGITREEFELFDQYMISYYITFKEITMRGEFATLAQVK